MNDTAALAFFSFGMACTISVLLIAARRTYRSEQERSMMGRMRRRLGRMLMDQKS